MENFKFALISIIIIASVGLLGYWAVLTIEPGEAHVYKEREEELLKENEGLKREVAQLKGELSAFEEETAPPETPATPPQTEKPPATTASKHQTLINDLQKLVDDKVFMKVGSRGTRVGTVQTFLNLYNKTSKKVDNDYGPGMKTDIMNFQKAVGLTADGEAGPSTFTKMIEWLKKQ